MCYVPMIAMIDFFCFCFALETIWCDVMRWDHSHSYWLFWFFYILHILSICLCFSIFYSFRFSIIVSQVVFHFMNKKKSLMQNDFLLVLLLLHRLHCSLLFLNNNVLNARAVFYIFLCFVLTKSLSNALMR